MLRIEPALPMLRIEPALPMLQMLRKLSRLPTLPRLVWLPIVVSCFEDIIIFLKYVTATGCITSALQHSNLPTR
jgi:hypothetical protein